MQQPNGQPTAPQRPGGAHTPNGSSKSSGAKLLAIVLGAGVAIAGIAIGASQSSASPAGDPAPRIDLASAEQKAVIDPTAKVDVGPGENKADDAALVAEAFRQAPEGPPNALITTSGPDLAVRVGPATRYLRSDTVASGTSVVVTCALPGEALSGRYGPAETWSYVPSLGGFVTDGFVFTADSFTAPNCRDGLDEAAGSEQAAGGSASEEVAEGSPDEGAVDGSVEGSDESAGEPGLPEIAGPAQPETVTEVVTTTAEPEPVEPETMTVTETAEGERVVETSYVEGPPVVQTSYVEGPPVVQTSYVEGPPAEPVTVVQTSVIQGEPQVVEVTKTAVETARTTDTEYVVDTEWVAKTTTEQATVTATETATVTKIARPTLTASVPTVTATLPTETLPTTRPTGTKPTTTKPTTTKPTKPEKPDECTSGSGQNSCKDAVKWANKHIGKTSSKYKNSGGDRITALAYGLPHTGSYSAVDHWRSVPEKLRKKGDRTVPAGGLAFFSGGSSVGHAVVSLGDGKFLSNGIKAGDKLSVTTLEEVEKKWGHKYLGWTQPWFESNPR